MPGRNKARLVDAPAPADGRRAVLVVGPPRSGTSAVAHMLSRLGVYFGEETDFVDPAIHTHNPIFFELQRLNELNERVLRELGYEYGDFDFFPTPDDAWDVFSEALLEDARRLVAEQLNERPLIGLKDPRFCFTLPFWTRVLVELGYATSFVWAVRPVGTAIRSNAMVNRLHETSYSARVTILSLGASAMYLKGLGPRIEVKYDDLVHDPRATAARLAAWLGSDRGIDEAAGVVREELRRQLPEQSGEDGIAIDVDQQADRYLALRGELERCGVLELLSRRRREVSGLSSAIGSRDGSSGETAAILGKLGSEIEARFAPLSVKVEWQSRALLEQSDYLREAMRYWVESQAQLGPLLEAVPTSIAPLVEKADWQSRALVEQGAYLRDAFGHLAESRQGEASAREALDAIVGALVEKVDWQSRALLEQGDFLRELARIRSEAERAGDEARAEAERFRRDLADASAALASARQDVAAEKLAREASESRNRELEQRLSEHGEHLVRAAKDLESASGRIAELELRAGDSQALRDEVSELAARAARLEQRLDEAVAARRQAERRAAGLIVEVEALQARIAALQQAPAPRAPGLGDGKGWLRLSRKKRTP